jgi:nicotinamidase-related amidase
MLAGMKPAAPSEPTRPRRALLVIDVQQEYDGDGALPIAFPPLPDALAAIGRAYDAALTAGLPVVVVQQSSPSGSPAFARGSRGWQLHPAIAGRPADLLVEKGLPSSFAGTTLDGWLRDRGVDTVTVVGFLTHNCDDSTARDAVHRGFDVELLSDATGTVALANRAGAVSAEALHRTTLVVMQSRFAAVATTDEWTTALTSGAPLERSSLLASAGAARPVDVGVTS